MGGNNPFFIISSGVQAPSLCHLERGASTLPFLSSRAKRPPLFVISSEAKRSREISPKGSLRNKWVRRFLRSWQSHSVEMTSRGDVISSGVQAPFLFLSSHTERPPFVISSGVQAPFLFCHLTRSAPPLSSRVERNIPLCHLE